MKINSTEWIKKKNSIFNSIFPREYNFEDMLAIQAEMTLNGVECFLKWLENNPVTEPLALEKNAVDVDSMRHDMEEKLINAFSTPFDRQDIYTLSRNMDYILNYSKETAREMYAFGVAPDDAILNMAFALHSGTKSMAEAVKIMKSEKITVEKKIREARKHMHEINDLYVTGMTEILNNDNAIEALKKREIYHHLKDAGRALQRTVDLLHKAVVGLN